MKYNKIQIPFALLGVLAILYAVNIFITHKASDALIVKPVQLSFMVIEAPKDTCQNCFDIQKVIKTLDARYDIKYASNNIAYNDPLSHNYIKLYDIKNLPAIVVSGDVNNKDITSAWQILSTRNKNGHIIIGSLLPDYSIADKKVKGLIDAVLLKDATCKNCFDTNEYIAILQRSGIVFNSIKTYDIASAQGKALVKKYSIVKIPAVLLSPNAGDYPRFTSSWKQVGNVGKDGWFIFRNVEKFNPKYEKI